MLRGTEALYKKLVDSEADGYSSARALISYGH